MNKLIVIQGPTASGKSTLALELAQEIKAPIVSADSRQFYKEMTIGTAKPSMEEMDKVPHFFIDTHSIKELTLTSAGFMKEGREKISELFKEGSQDVIVTGGSGMFIDALIDVLHPSPSDPKVREKLHQEWNKKGMAPLLEELQTKDPETHKKIDTSNPMRVLRALEITRVSGQTLEDIRKEPKDGIEYPVKRFCISWKREDLYERINLRVDQMIRDGLLDEVKSLPVKENLLLQNTVGYKEWIPYLDNGMSFEDTIAMIQKNSRNYGKRQETWMRRYSDLISLNPYDSIPMLDQLIQHI